MTNLPEQKSIRRGWFVVGFAAMLVGCCLVASFDRYQIINDACQYESTARNIRDGVGIKTSCLFYGEHLYSGEMPTHQTVFPPGLPYAMAAVSKATGLELHLAAFAINLTCFLVSALVLYSLCLRLGASATGAVVSSVAWLSVSVTWYCVWWGLTEPSFMLFTILSVRLLAERRWRFALLASLSASIAISIRYAGVFLIAAAAVNYFVLLVLDRKNYRKLIPEALLFGLPATAAVIALLARNARLVETPLGGNNYDLGQTSRRVVVRFVSGLTELFGLSRDFLLSGSTAEYIFVAAIAVTVLFAVRFLSTGTRRKETVVFFQQPTRLLSLLFPPIYFGAVLFLEYSKGSGLSDRVLMPAIPFAFAVLFALLNYSQQSKASRAIVNSICGALVVCFFVGQYSAYQLLARTSPPGPELHQILEAKMESGETLARFLQEHTSDEHPLLANQPQLVHGILKCPVTGLATGRYNTAGEPWNSQRVQLEIIDRFDVKHVLAIRGPKMKDRSTPNFFMELDRGKVPDRLKCIFQTDQVTLFEVIEPIRSSSL